MYKLTNIAEFEKAETVSTSKISMRRQSAKINRINRVTKI